MPFTFLGLPTHALIIHATVVLLPLTTLLLVACAFSARLRQLAGPLLPLAGVGCLVLVPITTSSGQQLQRHLPPSPAIAAHVRAANALLPWAIALAVMSVVVWWVGRRARSAGADVRASRLDARSRLSVALAVLATAVAVGTTVQVAYIGHLGATAAWSFAKDLPARADVAGDR